MMQTSIEEQLERQSLWKPSKAEQVAHRARALLASEFQDAPQKQEGLLKALTDVINFCQHSTPYYELAFNNKSFKKLEDLQELPILTKQLLIEQSEQLKPRYLPNGHKFGGIRQSSGTTGLPIKVAHTIFSNEVFTILKQREYRWFNYNPKKKLAVIRLPSQLPRMKGRELGLKDSFKFSGWGAISNHFKTGEMLTFSVLNDVEDQLRWLEETQTDYLTAYAESLEHLAFAKVNNTFSFKIQSLLSISETMTADMHSRISHAFNCPIQQNYGLNELGVIASKCPEGGRYHVHSEFYYVEIVNAEGGLCKAGETGRVLVTSLSNPAMPLVRYDTDDLAVATDQQCQCARTLPCFGEVVGRYSRIAYLPEGTLGQVAVIRDILSTLPVEQSSCLRRFQIHQDDSKNLELRLTAIKKIDPMFIRQITHRWHKLKPINAANFKVIQVEQLIAEKNGKFHDFTSYFIPVYTAP